jgi:hypothetical protein
MKRSEFSDRIQLTSPFKETLEDVSEELKLSIWNDIILPFAAPSERGHLINKRFIKSFAGFFGFSMELIQFLSHYDYTNKFRSHFFELTGIIFYNLLNYVSQKITHTETIPIGKEWHTFARVSNVILKEQSSPCRFATNFALTLMVDENELKSINDAMTTPYNNTVNIPMKNAAKALFSNNPKDCCSEAYSAIEALAKSKAGKIKNDFKNIINNLNIDPALKESIKAGWGFVSNKGRRGQNEEHCVYPTLQEAKFVLVFSSAFFLRLLLI